MKLLKLLIVLAFFESCCPKIIPVSSETTTRIDSVVTYKVRDSLIIVPPIYISVKDNVNCDSLNRAQMKKQVIKKEGLTHSVEIKDGKLISHCNADELKLKLQLRDKEIYMLKSTVTKQKSIIEVYKQHGYQVFLMWSGVLFWIVLFGFVAGWVLKKKTNFTF